MLFEYGDKEGYTHVTEKELKKWLKDDINRNFKEIKKNNKKDSEESEEMEFLDKESIKALAFAYTKIFEYLLEEEEPIDANHLVKAGLKAKTDLQFSKYQNVEFTFDFVKIQHLAKEKEQTKDFEFNLKELYKENLSSKEKL